MFKGSLRCFCLLLVLALLPLAGLAQEGEAPAYVSKDVLLVDGSIRYNDPDVARGIEEAMQGQGDPTDPKDVAKYATFIGVGFPNSNNYLDYCRAYGDVEITSAVTFDASSAAGVTDLSCLQFCTKARVVVINCEEVTGLAALAALPALESLYIHTEKPADLSALSGAKKLEYIEFSSCKGYDYTPLSGVAKLKGIALDHCDEADLLFTLNMKALTSLNVQGTPLRNFALLAARKTMNELMLQNVDVPMAELNAVLRGNPKLSALTLEGMDLTDCDALYGCKSLGSLSLYTCTGVSQDPEQWAGIKALYGVDIMSCGLTDASFLAGNKKLQWISLTDNQIQDVSFLEGYKKMGFVFLDINKITDLTPLLNLRCNRLSVSGNPYNSDSAVLEQLTANNMEFVP